MKLHTAAKIAIGLTGYGVWGLMAYLDPGQRHDFLVFNIGMATGTIGLALRDMQHHPTTLPKDSP